MIKGIHHISMKCKNLEELGKVKDNSPATWRYL